LTESIPKRPKVTGTPDQAFLFAKDFTKAVVKLVQTKIIYAFSTVTPGPWFDNSAVPRQPPDPLQPHGNPHNYHWQHFQQSRRIFSSQDPTQIYQPFSLLHHYQGLLTDTTNQKSFADAIVAALVPNIFVIYYGQKSFMEISLTMKLKQSCFTWDWDMTSGKDCGRNPIR
jgi:hypothetical protein